MNVIKTPTGLVPVDEPAELVTKAEYNNLTDTKKNNGTYYITNDDGTSVTSIMRNGVPFNPKPTVVGVMCVASNWYGSAAPYTNTIAVNGVTANNVVEVGLNNESVTDDQIKACMKASIAKITQQNGGIVLYAYGTKPTINIPLICVITNNN